jgi:hypothetical protein
MHYNKKAYQQITILVLYLFIISCNSTDEPKKANIVTNPQQMDQKASENIRAILAIALKNNGKIGDSKRFLFRKQR